MKMRVKSILLSKATLGKLLRDRVERIIIGFIGYHLEVNWTELTRRLPNSIFPGPLAYLLSVLCVFDEIPFTCRCEKDDKKAKGFQIRTCIGRFRVTSWK